MCRHAFQIDKEPDIDSSDRPRHNSMDTFPLVRNSESSYLPTLAPRGRKNHLGGVTGVAAVPGDGKQPRSPSLTARSTFQYTRRACPVIRSGVTVSEGTAYRYGNSKWSNLLSDSGAVRPGRIPISVVATVAARPRDGKHARSPSLTASSYYQYIRRACLIHPVRRNRTAWYHRLIGNFRMQQLGSPDSVRVSLVSLYVLRNDRQSYVRSWQMSLGIVMAVAAVPGGGRHARSPWLTVRESTLVIANDHRGITLVWTSQSNPSHSATLSSLIELDSMPATPTFPPDMLPSSGISILRLIEFPLPAIAQNLSDPSLVQAGKIAAVFLKTEPTWRERQEIVTIEVPAEELLTESLPIWIIPYWQAVASARGRQKRWQNVERFLMRSVSSWLDEREGRPAVTAVMHGALEMLYQRSDNEMLLGFSDPEPIHRLAPFASHDWLSTWHMDVQLELLRRDLARAGRHEVLLPAAYMYQSILLAFNDKDNYGDPKFHSTVLKLAHRMVHRNFDLASFANVDENHWIAFVISHLQHTVYYGDPMGNPVHAKFSIVINWWTRFHFGRTFTWATMKMTRQVDGFSCGILGGNGLRHFLLGPLYPLAGDGEKGADAERGAIFAQILLQDRDVSPPPELADEKTSALAGDIARILHLGPDARPITLRMLMALPRFSLETLVFLRLYGPRAYALCQEDDQVVAVLMDPNSSEDALLRSLRLAHHMHLYSAREDFRQSVIRGNSIFQEFFICSHEDIVAQAFQAAIDPLHPMPSSGLLGPSRFELKVVEIAGDPWKTNQVQITDRSVEKLTATLGAMGIPEWECSLSEVEGLHRKAVIFARDVREWQM
ncbi:hypothetical protein FIBSPDRAFT_894342 [Athelia psychrophila]|uniref:Ubiquitin-like protease family profile domain-containing protein n=1 Tax=Athelia psychrophila TaxID=1759441 RepID=A0A166G3A5_9AGAM|nr:hypothetical protein FIBSPDRAFT_894342 [Fibularhizoctonia sp. CBS 109695]